RLELKEDDVVLEPSAGDGVFIDEVLKQQPNINLTALDINPEAINTLNNKYADKPNIKVVHTDTLLDEQLDNYVIENGHYDKIIGNPPYGAWQDYEKRDFLKKKYKGFYVKESYAIFLLRSI
ncbi:methyltransferase domain-containing protein, partial [Butyricicoccus sp. 1XD8-22]